MSALIDRLVTLFSTPLGPIAGLALLVGLAAVIYTLTSAQRSRSRVRDRLRVAIPSEPKPADPARDAGRDALVLELPRSRSSELVDGFVRQADGLIKTMDAGKIKLLRQRLIRAGFFDQSAVALFFAIRLVMAVLMPLALFAVIALRDKDMATTTFLGLMLVATVGGYLAPSFLLDRRAKAVTRENRSAFPDFMDLMSVCANAGLSMEAGLERVSRELAPLYPTLGVNLQIVCLEVRAGRPIEQSLQSLADRLNVPEVRAFATLLQQSKELGSSLSDALRVFSDDMRHQRLAMAEEKAYALPAKLSVPVTACILPVVLFIAIWPVVVHFKG